MAVSREFGREVTTTLIRLGISQREAAKRTRISPGYISNMCLGQTPSMGKLLQFTGALGIDPTALLAAANYPPMQQVTGLAPEAAARQFSTSFATSPLLGEVPGGNWRLATMAATESFPVAQEFAERTDFTLNVVGDSMWPHLLPGDVVGVRGQDSADSGQVVVARLGDEVTIKCLARDADRLVLMPFNPKYQPIPIAAGDPEFAIIGVVLWHIHSWVKPDATVTRGVKGSMVPKR
ncbi:MAG: LexA family transcriptional regulator [bacterium]